MEDLNKKNSEETEKDSNFVFKKRKTFIIEEENSDNNLEPNNIK